MSIYENVYFLKISKNMPYFWWVNPSHINKIESKYEFLAKDQLSSFKLQKNWGHTSLFSVVGHWQKFQILLHMDHSWKLCFVPVDFVLFSQIAREAWQLWFLSYFLSIHLLKSLIEDKPRNIYIFEFLSLYSK